MQNSYHFTCHRAIKLINIWPQAYGSNIFFTLAWGTKHPVQLPCLTRQRTACILIIQEQAQKPHCMKHNLVYVWKKDTVLPRLVKIQFHQTTYLYLCVWHPSSVLFECRLQGCTGCEMSLLSFIDSQSIRKWYNENSRINRQVAQNHVITNKVKYLQYIPF